MSLRHMLRQIFFFNKNNKTSQIELRRSSLHSKFNSRKIEPGSIELYIFKLVRVFAGTRQLLGVKVIHKNIFIFIKNNSNFIFSKCLNTSNTQHP